MDLRPDLQGRREALRTISGGPYSSRRWHIVLAVTGTLLPDATCNYTYAGIHEGHEYWRRADGGYFIWWDLPTTSWNISVLLGTPGEAYWQNIGSYPDGIYSPMGTATGDATATIGEHP